MVDRLRRLKLLLRAAVRLAQVELSSAAWVVQLASRDPFTLTEWLGVGFLVGTGVSDHSLERLLAKWFRNNTPFLLRFKLRGVEKSPGFLFHGRTLYRHDYDKSLTRHLWQKINGPAEAEVIGRERRTEPCLAWITKSVAMLVDDVWLPWSDVGIGAWIAVPMAGKVGAPEWEKVDAVVGAPRYLSPAILKEMRQLDTQGHSGLDYQGWYGMFYPDPTLF